MRLLFELDKGDHSLCTHEFARPSARAILIRDGRIAMVHSLKYDYYQFPGGGIKKGEDPVQAVIRETLEEAGLTVIPDSVREYGLVRRIQKSLADPTERFLQENYYYLCEAEPEQRPQKLDSYEAEERFTPEFVEPETAIRVNRTGEHGSMDPMSLEREARVLELLMKEGFLCGHKGNKVSETKSRE